MLLLWRRPDQEIYIGTEKLVLRVHNVTVARVLFSISDITAGRRRVCKVAIGGEVQYSPQLRIVPLTVARGAVRLGFDAPRFIQIWRDDCETKFARRFVA